MIPYLGSKSQISDFIKQYVPKNPAKWIEPFGGGFGLYFTLDFKDYQDTQFIYNDVNPLNCNLFEHLKDKNFIDLIISTSVNKELFQKAYSDVIQSESMLSEITNQVDSEKVEESLKTKQKKKQPHKENHIEKKVIKVSNSYDKSLSWLILLCCGDNRDMLNGEYKGNSGFEMLKYKLPRYLEYFKKIQVSNLDYKEVIKIHDSSTSFFYLDPPYVGYEQYYFNGDFNKESHNQLQTILKDVKGKWLLSYYRFDKLEEWYSNYKIVSNKGIFREEFLVVGL